MSRMHTLAGASRRGPLRRLTLLLAAGVMAGGVFALSGVAGATKPPDHKVVICHRTNSDTNPYVSVNVDVASAKFAGHEGHNGPVWNSSLKASHTKWGDIIPPTSTDGTVTLVSKNWTAAGQAIWNNGCAVAQGSTTTRPSLNTTTTQVSNESSTTSPTTQPPSVTTPTTQVKAKTETPAPVSAQPATAG